MYCSSNAKNKAPSISSNLNETVNNLNNSIKEKGTKKESEVQK